MAKTITTKKPVPKAAPPKVKESQKPQKKKPAKPMGSGLFF
jgi:hypothetical protein